MCGRADDNFGPAGWEVLQHVFGPLGWEMESMQGEEHKPMFKSAFQGQRCVIPVAGFSAYRFAFMRFPE